MADGFPTTAEVKRLEAEADLLLKQDAQANGFIKDNGRGFSAYARAYGITTKKILETTYKHEQSLSMLMPRDDASVEDQLEFLRARGMDKRVRGMDDIEGEE